MKKIISAFIAVAASCMTIQASFAADGFDVEKMPPRPGFTGYTGIWVTTRLSEATILNLVANRGNCKIYVNPSPKSELTRPMKPFTRKFGGTFDFYTDCNPLELEIKTDKGTFTSRWQS